MNGIRHQINAWSDLDISDLVYAFRKAKSDCFYDRNICVAEKFVAYEADLFTHLRSLLEEVKTTHISSILSRNFGVPRIVAKKLGVQPKSDGEQAAAGHTFFSDPARAFERMCAGSDVTPEFRLIGDFPVEMHVLSALWINVVGHKFDAVLSESAYGSRLRRYKPEPGAPEGAVGPYHIEAIGSFERYFEPYKRWRENGLSAIRSELKSDRSVIAISLDLTSYYHQIDPGFMANKSFLRAVGVVLSAWEEEFNDAFISFLQQWSSLAVNEMSLLGISVIGGTGGIPIGLSATRVISNVLLTELDSDIEKGLAPVYYGRYVDDIFLVMKDPGDLTNSADILRYIAQRTRCFPPELREGFTKLTLPNDYQGSTVLSLQESKQKAFFLHGSGGLDLLDSIETQIRSVSSERRLMPSVDRLSSMSSAKVLSAAGHPSEEADTLRRADGLSVRRLSWSLQLRAVEILARDLREDDWVKERKEFYRFAHSHILRPDKILDHIDYLPRLLSLAVAMTDWIEARRLFDAAMSALNVLRVAASSGFKINGLKCEGSGDRVWDNLSQTVTLMAQDAIVRSIRWDSSVGRARHLPGIATQFCELVGIGDSQLTIEARALAIRESDWAKTSYKDHLRRHASRQRPITSDEVYLWTSYTHVEDLIEFLSLSQASSQEVGAARVHSRCKEVVSSVSLLPFIFPTRAYSTQEISLFLPDICVLGDGHQTASSWAKYTRAVRGVWVWGSAEYEEKNDGDETRGVQGPVVAELGGGGKKRVLLGISSLLTNDVSWSAAASGRPDLSRERYARLETIVNQAVSAYPKPTYLLLPELALPERWIDTVSSMLRSAGISLIAGLDYQFSPGGRIHSSAVLVLSDSRLGFPATVEIRQVKSLPAPAEEKALEHSFGRLWTTLSTNKPVYRHEGFCFGVLVCSELQNVNHRLQFQGNVDCLVVLSWNQDLETFSALVDSASLDVHASVALVNNRRYGDSRVRVPAKRAHERDLCRLRGGQNEHVVVVEIEYEELRAFQSRAKRWPDYKDPYKPVPEGFVVARYRKAIPS